MFVRGAAASRWLPRRASTFPPSRVPWLRCIRASPQTPPKCWCIPASLFVPGRLSGLRRRRGLRGYGATVLFAFGGPGAAWAPSRSGACPPLYLWGLGLRLRGATPSRAAGVLAARRLFPVRASAPGVPGGLRAVLGFGHRWACLGPVCPGGRAWACFSPGRLSPAPGPTCPAMPCRCPVACAPLGGCGPCNPGVGLAASGPPGRPQGRFSARPRPSGPCPGASAALRGGRAFVLILPLYT